jgi:hypothetical protein
MDPVPGYNGWRLHRAEHRADGDASAGGNADQAPFRTHVIGLFSTLRFVSPAH